MRFALTAQQGLGDGITKENLAMEPTLTAMFPYR